MNFLVVSFFLGSPTLHPFFTLKPILPLRPHSQHKHCVNLSQIAVKRDITTRSATNDEFAFSTFHGPPNQRAVGQYLYGFQNAANSLGRRVCVKLGDVFKEAVKVVKDLWGQLNASHALIHLTIFRAVGLRAGSPFARAAR